MTPRHALPCSAGEERDSEPRPVGPTLCPLPQRGEACSYWGMNLLHSTTAGRGEPIVLIHGLGHRHQVWRALTERLVPEGMRVISIDLPGHGLSSRSWLPWSYSIDATVSRIVETMDALGVERPHLVGNSLGGLIVLELAARGYGRSVTALAPAGFSPPLHLLKAGAALLANRINFARSPSTPSAADDAERPLPTTSPGDRVGFVQRLRSLHSWAGFAGFLPHAFLARFQDELEVPATIAWGDRDVILDSGGLRRAAGRTPAITWVELENCGHFPMIDVPDETARLVMWTVRRASGQPRPVRDGRSSPPA